MDGFLYQASIYLAAAVLAVPISARLGLGSVLGYLAAGILIGPGLGLVGTETADLQHFAEFGVVMMLFLIGLELDPRALWNMRHKLVGLGGLQVVLCTLAIMGVAMAYGQPWGAALAIGMSLALSSTAIVLQTLSEKGLMQTSGGRSVFSTLLAQDIAVIPMLALLPLLVVTLPVQITPDGSIMRTPHTGGHDDLHGAGYSLVEGLSTWETALVTIGTIIGVIAGGVFLVRQLFFFIGKSNLREMYTALALLIVVGISFLMLLVGLSPALGAFLAGVILASSEFRHDMESHLEPFKGLLLGLFFITVGAGINFDLLFSNIYAISVMAVLVILTKGVILWPLGRAFGLRGRHKWLYALSLAQAGEFGFVLISFSVGANVVSERAGETLLLVIALSMLITPLLFILYDRIVGRLEKTITDPEPDEIDASGPVIIVGIGRFGQIANRLVRASGFETVVLDHDIEIIQLMRRFGYRSFRGDPKRPEFLQAAGIDKARVLVVAVDDPDAAVQVVINARKARPDLHIVARAYDRPAAYRLYRAGANDIVRETFDSALRAGRYVLENVGLTKPEAADAERVFFNYDRATLRELAELWEPGTPTAQNKAYVDRSKALYKDLETEILNRTQDIPRT